MNQRNVVTPLAPLTLNVNQSYERNDGGCAATEDTDDNAANFRVNAVSSTPENMTFNCNSCVGVVCTAPPNGDCWKTQGTCKLGTCSYTQIGIGSACSDGDACTLGDTCNASGVCNPGSAAVCNTPPASTCSDPKTLVTYMTGTCSAATGCTYTKVTTSCPFGCNGTTLQCDPDPCTNKTCTTPPANGCYDAAGTCAAGACI